MTFSIVARDATTGALGVATATGGPVVGSLVPHARAGLCAIVTQAHTNPLYAADGLALLESGLSPEAAIARLTQGDSLAERRQVAIIDAQGRMAGWTGAACLPAAGHVLHEGLAVAGNMLADHGVLAAMAQGFAGAEGSSLAGRLLAAMQAGQGAGGDYRGARSAALKVYTSEPYPAVDLRIDWSETPIDDLARLFAEVCEGAYADFVRTLPTRANPAGLA